MKLAPGNRPFPRSKWRSFRSPGLAAILLGLLPITACGGGGGEGSNQSSGRTTTGDTTPSALFTEIPLEQAHYKSILPLGNLNPSGHVFPTGHHYLALADPNAVVPVRSPGHIWITRVSRMEHVTAGFTDYKLAFDVSQEVEGEFGHLSSLESSILDEVGTFPTGNTYSTGGETYNYSSKNVSIEVTAGTVIGTAGGNPGQYALDFGVYDSLATNTFANPSRISQMGSYANAVSCLDYFSADKKALLQGACGNWDGTLLRTASPVGGTVSQDIPGTGQGIWFRNGEPNYPEDAHIALVHDNVDPDIPVISVGTSISGLPSGTYSFTPQGSGETNREFSSITADGKIYGYQDFSNGQPHVIVLQMINAETMRVERQAPGSGAPWNFNGTEVTFDR